MSAPELIHTPLDEEQLALIDALAKAQGFTREEMIVKLIRIGLPLCEREAEEGPDRGEEGAS